MKRFFYGLGPGLLFFLAACSAANSPSDEPTVNQQGPETGLCSNETGEVDIRGQWAVRADLDVEGTQRQDALISLCPDNPQVAGATAWIKLDFQEAPSGSTVNHIATICALDLSVITAGIGTCPADPADFLEIRIALGGALQTYLPTVQIPGKSSIVAKSPNGSLSTDKFEFFGGTQGSDDDSDGKAGVTLDFTTGGDDPAVAGEVYAEFELSPLFRGRIHNSRCIEGSTQVVLDYYVIDRDIELAGTKLDTEVARQNIPTLRVLNSSTFRALRANGEEDHDFDDDSDGNISCEEILQHSSLFQR
ncbi:MAG: hypothetical protein IPJ88_02670 [Myxococcales bacterium]|nr:MAG: hypothetical protein IPJ88_02670 [Myxococcales bacterium]